MPLIKSILTKKTKKAMAKIIHHTGNYQGWNVYRKAVIVCDLTEVFLSRFMVRYGRTIDPMSLT